GGSHPESQCRLCQRKYNEVASPNRRSIGTQGERFAAALARLRDGAGCASRVPPCATRGAAVTVGAGSATASCLGRVEAVTDGVAASAAVAGDGGDSAVGFAVGTSGCAAAGPDGTCAAGPGCTRAAAAIFGDGFAGDSTRVSLGAPA